MKSAKRLGLLTVWISLIIPSLAMAENGGLNIGEYFKTKKVAKGDCTDALRNAFELAGKERKSVIYFPPGNYNISDVINISAATKIYSDGQAIIQQSNPDKDIFYTKSKWRIKISGISFRGGKNQLVIGNPNIDQSFFVISDCDFRKSSGYAIKILDGTRSAYCLVDRCTFKYPFQCFYNSCDKATFANSWITTNKENIDSGVFLNKGVLTIKHLLGVPHVSGKKQRWVDNYGTLTCFDCRFGGEGGGISIVYNYAAADFKYPVIPNAVNIDKCDVYCAGKAAVVCNELPNKISIKDCRGFVDCWMFDFKPLGDIDKHLRTRVKHYDNPNYQLPLFVSIDKYRGRGSFPVALLPYMPAPITYLGDAEPEGFGAPEQGSWRRGAVIYNPNGSVRVDQNKKGVQSPKHCAVNEPYGWLCIESGVPGRWATIENQCVEKEKNNETLITKIKGVDK